MYFHDQFNPHNFSLKRDDILDNRYQIIELLGEGGFGKTYQAKDLRRNNEIVVVKQLKPEFLDEQVNNKPKELFKREAQALLLLKNSQTMTPKLETDVIENDGYVYFVMEYIRGKTLDEEELKEGNKLEEKEVIKLLQDMLKLLKFIHKQGLVHRDIKPDNIIRRDDDNSLTLIDFGSVTKTEYSSTFTRIGNHDYCAPEQWEGNAEPSSDLYALGIIVIQGLTGRIPSDFPKDPMDFNSNQILLDYLIPHVSEGLKNIIKRMILMTPKERYQSAEEVLITLEQIQSYSEEEKQNLSPKKSKPKPPIFNFFSKTNLQLLAVGSLLLILVGLFWKNLANFQFKMAVLYHNLEDVESAKKHYLKAAQGGLIEAYNNLSYLYIQDNQNAQALQVLQQALPLLAKKDQSLEQLSENSRKELEAQRYSLFKNIGWARFNQKRYEEAKNYLSMAIGIANHPDYQAVIPNPGAAYCLYAQLLPQDSPESQKNWQKCQQLIELRLAAGSRINAEEDTWLYEAKKRKR
ncbi:protein kinase domain-containing protein [Crocosphaera sp.]|uniref:protein kinase domain-containing protein n=1 Tax=Crocosphaera sp. TaxID=2729996 RepID=UPI003F28ABAE|nr:serine/threonine-protein kinase [Crocosphaera sp.]